MNCPKCGKSLWFVRDVCPFCKTVIATKPAEALAPEPDRLEETESDAEPNGSWVTLTKCSQMVEADLLVSRLEAAGIKAYLPDELVMQTTAWNLNTYGYIRVQVAQQDLEAAEALLISPPDVGQAEPNLAAEKEITIGDASLSGFMKGVALLLPVFFCASLAPFLIARGAYLRQGADRKNKEWTQWFLIGFGCWAVVYIFIVPRFIEPK